jgi:hypothetical protein
VRTQYKSVCTLSISRVISLLILTFLPIVVQAQVTFTVPATSTNGNYRVEWSNGVAGVVLVESKATGDVTIGSFPANGYKDFTNQPVGSYEYYLRVYSFNSTYTTTSHKIVRVMPFAPGSINVSQQGTSVNASWAASTTANVTYKLFRSGTASPIYTGSALTYLDSGISYNTNYVYSVQSCVGSNCSALISSSSISVVPSTPSPPASVTAKQALNRNMVAWGSSALATYYVLRRNGSVLVNNLNALKYTDSAIVNGTGYVYSVAACNTNGCSSAVSATSVTAGVPTAGQSMTRNYQYDALSRLEKVKVNNTDKTVYTYDKAGNRTAVEEK